MGGVEWKKYGDFSHHLTLPGSGLPIYLNGTSATFNAVLGNLAAVGLSKSGWPFSKMTPHSKQDQQDIGKSALGNIDQFFGKGGT